MLALAVTSCQKTEDLAGNTGNQADVRIAVNLPAEMNAVRSQENPGIGDMVNRCIMEIYLDGELYGERQVAAVENKQTSFSARLVSGKTYKFVFWADCAEGTTADNFADKHYATDDLSNVSILDPAQYSGSNDERDAFFAVKEVEVSTATTVSAELRRPFGQLNVKTLDMNDVPESLRPTKVALTFDEVPTGINLLTGELTQQTAAVAYAESHELADASGNLSFDYVFAPQTAGEQRLVNFTMSFLDDAGTQVASDYEFTNIPVQRNYRTNVSGNLLTKKADINVEVKPEFDGVIEPWDGESLKAVTPVSKEFDGAVRDVYCIYNPAEMAWVADQLNAGNNQIKYLEIENDIDMGGYALAITRASNIVLEGQGYTLSNYSVEKNTQSAGLFCDAVSVTVRNLTIENANVKAVNDGNGNAYAGALMGRTYGTIVLDNVHSVNSTVEGVNKVGGLVGFVAENHIEATNCSVKSGSVTTSFVEGESGQIGGLVGYLGSLFGSTCTFTGCSVEDTVINAYMTREDRTVSKFIGCFQGNQASDVVVIDNCRVVNVTLNALDDMAASHFSQYGDLLGGQRVGNGTVRISNSDTSIVISTAAQLVAFSDLTAPDKGKSFSGKTVKLDADIDLNGVNWVPANCFSASKFVFDGQGHTIKNMSAINNLNYGNGFFSNIVGGTVKNVTFDNARVSRFNSNTLSGNIYGIVSGYTYGNVLFENVHVKNSAIYGYGKVGGIIGMASDKGGTTVLTDCSVSDTDIYGVYNAGGLIGMAQNQVELNNPSTENVRWGYPSSETYVELNETATDAEGNPIVVNGTYWKYSNYYYAAWADYYSDYYYSDQELSNGKYLADGLCHNK